MRPAVDLPQPDSPTRPTVSPGHRLRSMPSTALTGASACFTSVWRNCGKCFCSPTTFSSGGPVKAELSTILPVSASRTMTTSSTSTGAVPWDSSGVVASVYSSVVASAGRLCGAFSATSSETRAASSSALGATRSMRCSAQPGSQLLGLLGGQLVVVGALRGRARDVAAVLLGLLGVVPGTRGGAEDVPLAPVLALLRVVALAVIRAHGSSSEPRLDFGLVQLTPPWWGDVAPHEVLAAGVVEARELRSCSRRPGPPGGTRTAGGTHIRRAR